MTIKQLELLSANDSVYKIFLPTRRIELPVNKANYSAVRRNIYGNLSDDPLSCDWRRK